MINQQNIWTKMITKPCYINYVSNSHRTMADFYSAPPVLNTQALPPKPHHDHIMLITDRNFKWVGLTQTIYKTHENENCEVA